MTKTFSKKHGGKRKGAGRKSRADGRKLRIIKVPLTDVEFEMVKNELSTDDRRDALLLSIRRKYQI